VSRSLLSTGSRSFALVAVLFGGAAGCLSDYGSDCDRNVDLQCFWQTRGGPGGSGGAGGGATTTTDGGGGAGAAGGATMVTTTSTTTVASACGNGDVEEGEACDDGNTEDCDGCRADCSAEETGCGDGFTCGDEECDDGNQIAGDGCRECRKECNTGTIQGGSNAAVYTDVPGQRCYVRVSASPKSWGAARTQCQQWKGDLFAFGNLGELASVLAALPGPNSVWTCGKGAMSPDGFSWQSGDPWPPSAPWAAGQPDSADTECVELLSDGTLADQSCNKLNAFVCERPLTAGP
jgi:cysteine-rich repeat protein